MACSCAAFASPVPAWGRGYRAPAAFFRITRSHQSAAKLAVGVAGTYPLGPLANPVLFCGSAPAKQRLRKKYTSRKASSGFPPNCTRTRPARRMRTRRETPAHEAVHHPIPPTPQSSAWARARHSAPTPPPPQHPTAHHPRRHSKRPFEKGGGILLNFVWGCVRKFGRPIL